MFIVALTNQDAIIQLNMISQTCRSSYGICNGIGNRDNDDGENFVKANYWTGTLMQFSSKLIESGRFAERISEIHTFDQILRDFR